MAGVFIARTPTFFFLLSPSIESFVAPLQIAILWLPWVPSRAQLANELLSNLHHAARSRAQHECSTAVDLSYSVRCWIDGLQHYVWRSKVRPHDQDSALLQNSSRENARRAALSVLCAKSEHACESLRFAWSSGDLRWGIDERKQRWRRRRSRKGKNSWWGHFCQIMRQRNEKGLQSTTRKDLRRAKTKRHNVPDSRRALHMHGLERDFGIRAACMQHDCATCASMLRDAVTAAQSRFLATHCCVTADLRLATPNSKRTVLFRPDYERTDWPALCSRLNSLPLLESIQGTQNIEAAWQVWHNLVWTCVANNVPFRTITIRGHRKKWVTPFLRMLSRKKQRLFRTACRLQRADAWAAYRKLRNRCNAEHEKEKKQYFARQHDKLEQEIDGSRHWWSRAASRELLPHTQACQR